MSKKLYQIEWLDAFGEGQWEGAEPSRREYRVKSIGWKVRDDKRYVGLAQSLDDQGHRDHTINIPKKMIIRKRWIRA